MEDRRLGQPHTNQINFPLLLRNYSYEGRLGRHTSPKAPAADHPGPEKKAGKHAASTQELWRPKHSLYRAD